MDVDVEKYTKFLQAKKKPNGDKLLPSTIERYSEWIERYIGELKSHKNIDELIKFMNSTIKSAGSNVLTAAYMNYLSMMKVPSDKVKGIEPCKSGASALTSQRFLQSKVLSRGELRRILNETQDSKTKAIVSALYDTACRRSELLNMKFGDVEFKNPSNPNQKKDIESGIWAEVSVLGKGHKKRKVYLGKTTVMLLTKIHAQDPYKKVDKLFLMESDDGKVYSYQEHELWKVVRRLGKNILDRNIHPHCFRHTKATHLADSGADLLDIAAYLGHANPQTAAIYIEISAYRGKQAFMKYSQDIGVDI